MKTFDWKQATWMFGAGLLCGVVLLFVSRCDWTPEPPAPPEPPKPPVVVPIAEPGLRVAILEEQRNRENLPPAQLEILFSAELMAYLDAACVKGPDGKTPERRIFDKDVDTTNESKLWQDVLKREHPTLPWIVVSNGKDGFEGPLPANVAETIALIKKYEGSK